MPGVGVGDASPAAPAASEGKVQAIVVLRVVQRRRVIVLSTGKITALLDDIIGVRRTWKGEALAFDPKLDSQFGGQLQFGRVRNFNVAVGGPIKAERLANLSV